MQKIFYIGIDPDTNKSGFAVYNADSKRLTLVKSLKFPELINELERWEYRIIKVRIEAGWLNAKSNFHSSAGQTKAAGERIAKNVGRNQEVGKKIAEMCDYMGIEYELIKPIGTKNIDSKTFAKITGWVGSTNQDSRDAAMLVWNYNDLKINRHGQI